MNYLSVLLLSLFLLQNPLLAQKNAIDTKKQAYCLFSEKGKTTNYKKLLKDASKADIVFFGELHNNPICHWLQIELTRDLYAQVGERLVLGAEMFEADNQLTINEYMLGFLSEKNFEQDTRLWNNYQTDYKPVLEFAREFNIRFVASNVPRRYASLVFRAGLEGLDNLPAGSKLFMAPLPLATNMDLRCYREMLEMGGGDENFPKAQMLKDATMAHFILRNWSLGEVFLHLNGSFHSDRHEGIAWYLRQRNPDLRILVISTIEQESLDRLDPQHEGKGDYILVTPSRMTKTY